MQGGKETEVGAGSPPAHVGVGPAPALASLLVLVLTLTAMPALAGTSLRRSPGAAAGSSFPTVLLPETGAHFGSWVRERSGENSETAIQRVEGAIGRTFAIDHQYYQWTKAVPTQHEYWTTAQGRIPFLNWKLRNPWSSVADGSQDAWIRARADAFKAFGAPVYLTLHHEPEDDYAFGSTADYIAAYRRVVDIFRERGVTNVAFVWTMMAWTFDARSGRDPMTWYPGDAYVDFVGSDGFNWWPTKPKSKWESFETVYKDTNAFAVARSKPWIAVEYGVQEDPGDLNRKANWYRDALATTKTWPRLKALIYFDETKLHDNPAPGTPYPWITDSSPASIAAYAAVANDPYFLPGQDEDDDGDDDPPVDPPVEPEPADVVSNTFDAGTNGAPVEMGNSLDSGTAFDLVQTTAGGSITFDRSRSNLGGAARIALDPKRAASYGWSDSFRWGPRWFGRIDVWLPAAPAQRLRLVQATRGGARRMAIWLRPDGRLAFEDARGRTRGAIDEPLPIRTWVRIEWGVDAVARTVDLRAVAATNGNTGPTGRLQLKKVVLRGSPDRIRIGRIRKTRSPFTFWTDNPALSVLGYPARNKPRLG